MTIISYMTDVLFDTGAIRELPCLAARHQIRRPFIITDEGVAAAGLSTVATAGLGHCPIFDATPPNPTETAVELAVAAFKGASADGIIAVGGGSVIDLAKAVALAATHPGPLPDYAAIANGTERITRAVAPVVAVPTTSGSGSEVGRAALIVLRDRRKVAFISPYLLPRCAICDPALTISMPHSLTAGSGMDAIAHCIETLLSPRINPPAEAIAIDGLQRAFSNIERAIQLPSDTLARSEMMMASLEGGLCFQKGLGAVHALSHALCALDAPALHHGTVNGVLLPAVVRFNEMVCAQKYGRIRSALHLAPELDLADRLAEMQRSVGLPTRLRDLGVKHESLQHVAREAMHDLSHLTNPRSANEDDYLRILNESF
jgi:4-hydroxybutyrate dehydrogenase